MDLRRPVGGLVELRCGEKDFNRKWEKISGAYIKGVFLKGFFDALASMFFRVEFVGFL